MRSAKPIIVGVINYQAGNIQSIINAVEHLGAVSRKVETVNDLKGLSHLVLPGVGAFGFCAEKIRASRLLAGVEQWTLVDRRPILGICVGMQLLADVSNELGQHKGLGWCGGRVERLVSTTADIRIPHVGWNTVTFDEEFGEFRSGDATDFYFDHSYAYQEPTLAHRVASCTHGQAFCAVIRNENLLAAQFHPEKSQEAGMSFLRSFFEMQSYA